MPLATAGRQRKASARPSSEILSIPDVLFTSGGMPARFRSETPARHQPAREPRRAGTAERFREELAPPAVRGRLPARVRTATSRVCGRLARAELQLAHVALKRSAARRARLAERAWNTAQCKANEKCWRTGKAQSAVLLVFRVLAGAGGADGVDFRRLGGGPPCARFQPAHGYVSCRLVRELHLSGSRPARP